MNFNNLKLEAFDHERKQWCKIIAIDVEREHIWMSNGCVQFSRDLLSTTIRTPLIKEPAQQHLTGNKSPLSHITPNCTTCGTPMVHVCPKCEL